MKANVQIDQLTDGQWMAAQELLQPSYDIPAHVSRVCLTLVHGEETRHVEAPVSVLFALTGVLVLTPALQATGMAMALLTPDDDGLPETADQDPDEEQPSYYDLPSR